MTTPLVQLSPCPFCGSEAERGESKTRGGVVNPWVSCSNIMCGAMVRGAGTGVALSRADAENVWNKRVATPSRAGGGEVGEWLAMDSAPRDGTAILGLWLPSAGAYTRFTGMNYGITAYSERRKIWFDAAEDDEEDNEFGAPDMWQPLIPPAALHGAGARGGE